MRKYFFLTFLILFFSCSDSTKLQTITVGDYSFDFPNNFKLIKGKGIDSYVGMIKGDSIELGFDYGYYSDPLIESQQEYLDKKFWLMYAADQFMKEGITYDANNSPKVELISLRKTTPKDTGKFKGADFIATCKHDSIVFDYPVTIPEKTKQHITKVDTIDNHFRKIVIATDPMKGLTGIYLKDLNSYNKSINGYLALSMAANKLTKQQQDTVLKIFSTVHFMKKKK